MNNLEKEINSSGNIRNSVWVTEKFKAGKLLINDIKPTQKAFDEFKLCIRIINEIYEKAWDISFHAFENPTMEDCTINIDGIYIFFPEILITNAKGEKHTIKELIVKIELYINNSNRLMISNLLGGRFNLSYAEYQSDYYHSHLPLSKILDPNIPAPYLGHFCTGSGEINMYQSELNGDGITEERFIKYAMQLMTLVSYESLEGMPYRKMRNIAVRQGGNRPFYVSVTYLQPFVQKVIGNVRTLNKAPFNFYLDSQGLYRISNDETFKKFLEEDMNYSETEIPRYFCSTDTSGNYYRYDTTITTNTPPTYNKTFLFRGEEKRLVVDKNPTDDVTLQHIIHPKLIENAIEKLEYELNKNKVRESTINRYKHKSRNARKSIKSNTIPVPTNCKS